ncbi:uncharacterized protein LOC107489220 [Arachis duranensis]|uniref:Uncharacterized protein LOC107489220 n=1 Tax=Arachis duranensis TaxID=130453 RepID=A0A6P4DBL6_ARADU|nr:uncharacterized protein LOC107489220 [Arachis duranensis]
MVPTVGELNEEESREEAGSTLLHAPLMGRKLEVPHPQMPQKETNEEHCSQSLEDSKKMQTNIPFVEVLKQWSLSTRKNLSDIERGKLVLRLKKDYMIIKCDLYKGICEAVVNGDNSATTYGRRIVFPATFVGGPKYIIQNYQDAMAICTKVGYPDLFLTFTCNPKWPEIVNHLSTRGLKAEDRPVIVCRTFKMKLDSLVKELPVNMLFGRVVAVVYTIEFQKRGLPHAHILLFLHKGDKLPTPDDIGKIISAKILDKSVDAKYYEAVSNLMIHGPCGASLKDSPCMDNGRDNGRTIKKSGIELDNRWVIPHNQSLLLKYGAHINVEWCNQSRSIKYLFKHVNKGHDRVTASFYREGSMESLCDEIDEIKMYYDYHESLKDVVERPTINQSMFLAWFEANREFEEAKQLSYVDFPSKFIWNANSNKCHRRRSHHEACIARGLLDNDREYIEAIEEASIWGSGEYLRNLFATLLFSNSMNRPLYVWEKTWEILSDEIQTILKRNNRSLMDYPDMPFPNIDFEDDVSCDLSNNNLFNDELLYDRQYLRSTYLIKLAKMTTEQKNVYDTIINSVD